MSVVSRNWLRIPRIVHDENPAPSRAAFRPTQSRLASHGDARRPFNRFNNSNQLRRPKRPAELHKPRREIDHRKEPVGVWKSWFRGCWCSGSSAACPSLHRRDRWESRPPSLLSRRVENTGSESKRGIQHQTTSPLLWTKAENWQFPTTPRSSRCIVLRTLAHGLDTLVFNDVMPRMAQFILALIVGLALLTWAATDVVQTTARGWFERDVSSRARLVLAGASQSLANAWYGDPGIFRSS